MAKKLFREKGSNSKLFKTIIRENFGDFLVENPLFGMAFVLIVMVIASIAMAPMIEAKKEMRRWRTAVRKMECTDSNVLMKGSQPYLRRTGCIISFIGKSFDQINQLKCNHIDYDPMTEITTMYDCSVEIKITGKSLSK